MPGTIVSSRELGRTFEREIDGQPIARRRWAVNLSDNTLANNGPPGTQALIEECIPGSWTSWNQAHPDLSFLKLRKVTLNERFEDDPYKVEVIAEYGFLTSNDLLHPTSRIAVWSMSGSPGEVPALFYYDGTTQRPLTNTAGDYFPGLVTQETLVQIKIQKNFASLPSSWLAVQNHVNSGSWLGCGPDTIKVAAVDTQYTISEWSGQEVVYWESTATLEYRQSSHNLLLPDVGWNYIFGGQVRRAMVFDFQNNEWVASANPVGLNGVNGGLSLGAPGILNRRVNPRADLAGIFGNPP